MFASWKYTHSPFALLQLWSLTSMILGVTWTPRVREQSQDGCRDILTSVSSVDVQVKTDLLHVYTNDAEDASPLELRSFNVELLQKKINDLEEENKNLHDEASQVIPHHHLDASFITLDHLSWRMRQKNARRKKRSSLRTQCNIWPRPIFRLRTSIINLPTRWDFTKTLALCTCSQKWFLLNEFVQKRDQWRLQTVLLLRTNVLLEFNSSEFWEALGGFAHKKHLKRVVSGL